MKYEQAADVDLYLRAPAALSFRSYFELTMHVFVLQYAARAIKLLCHICMLSKEALWRS